MLDKYGAGQDPYCLPGTSILNNRLGLISDEALNEAERSLSAIAANEVDFEPPPYNLSYLCGIHRQLVAWISRRRNPGFRRRNPAPAYKPTASCVAEPPPGGSVKR